MRWDDLQLLKVIDDLEQSGQYISNGLTLLEQAAQGQTIRQDQEATPFARELLLAHDAGYLTRLRRLNFERPIHEVALRRFLPYIG
jgi:hypothetical protein